MNLRDDLLEASKLHFKANIERHRINVENLLNNSVGVGEHPDIIETIESELEKMSSYHDKLEMLDYFDISIDDKKILNG
jgi:tetrahydrodipicolinate N-succinyltransferase|tara:strand:+ start:459 stop:695 length:237 start_codon:yes stop_codon:yes gene_type:complete